MKNKIFTDEETGVEVKLPRKVKHRYSKQFGYAEDKFARGQGNKGYARSYGHNTSHKNRTRTETINAVERLQRNN